MIRLRERKHLLALNEVFCFSKCRFKSCPDLCKELGSRFSGQEMEHGR